MCHPGQIALAAVWVAMDDSISIPSVSETLSLASHSIDGGKFVQQVLATGPSEKQEQAKQAVERATNMIKEAVAVGGVCYLVYLFDVVETKHWLCVRQHPKLNNIAKKLEKRRKRCSNPAFIKGTPEYEERLVCDIIAIAMELGNSVPAKLTMACCLQRKKEEVRLARKAKKKAEKLKQQQQQQQ